ncbi:MAG: peptidylprolyl isomerase [Waltera sp.]|uniref:peptidylprolyl isomerase n=1 Tax=Waltera sp. TaxID=2815806 RepID=UPI0039934ECB
MSKNEKVTENKEQTEQKVMTKYDRKVQKRKEEKEKEKKEERISTAIGIVVLVALVCLVASFPIRTYLATHETYVVVNGEAVNKVEFDYQYNLTKNNYITQYGSYLTYFGLDTSKDLSTQMYSDTLTWQDYFEQNAVESLKQNKALMAEAKAAGFTYDTTDEYNTFKETIKTSAASAGISEKEYVRSIYGSYATMGRIEEYVKNDMVMNAYYQKLQEDNAPSDDEIQSYYEENKATYDSVDYRLTTIEADLPTEPTELADPVEETAADTTGTTDGTAATDSTQDTAYQPSDAEIAKAMEDAKVLADDAEHTVAKDGEAHENEKKSSVNYLISDWLFDDARKAGDTTVITNDNSHCYYAVAFEKRYLDETPSADVRVIIPTEDKTGEEILEEWKNGAATEDSFAELCKKYTQDTSAVENGGLFEQVTKTGMTEELSNWIFDTSRQAGDTVAITVSDTTYVLYYIGQDQPEWKINIKNTLVSDTMSQHMQDITADVTVEDPKGKLNYLKVQAEESAAAETATAETQEITEEQTAATEETATQAQ